LVGLLVGRVVVEVACLGLAWLLGRSVCCSRIEDSFVADQSTARPLSFSPFQPAPGYGEPDNTTKTTITTVIGDKTARMAA
jgi:hypothetical protein